MCKHWYSKCEKCGRDVHAGFLCDCGNDLHGVVKRAEDARKEARKKYALAQKALRVAHKELVEAEMLVSRLKTRQDIYRDSYNIRALRASLNQPVEDAKQKERTE